MGVVISITLNYTALPRPRPGCGCPAAAGYKENADGAGRGNPLEKRAWGKGDLFINTLVLFPIQNQLFLNFCPFSSMEWKNHMSYLLLSQFHLFY
jgi:hypothetical protein